jgi:hypothetical protein
MPTYAEKLEELQRLRSEVRRLERLAETEAKNMRPLTEADERAMTAIAVKGRLGLSIRRPACSAPSRLRAAR